MPIVLSRYINQPVLVSIPALFDDGGARPFTLMGVEGNGLWLRSDLLTDRLLQDEGRELVELEPMVFVPFAQIAGVVLATKLPRPPAASAKTPKSRAPGRSRATKRVTAPASRR